MTALPFELARKLKDAGWPQPNFTPEEGCYVDGRRLEGVYVYEDEENWDKHYETACHSPSLSELIAACGDGFDNLHRFEPFQFEEAPRVRWRCNWGETEDRSDTTDPFLSPEEAVANLWLVLSETK